MHPGGSAGRQAWEPRGMLAGRWTHRRPSTAPGSLPPDVLVFASHQSSRNEHSGCCQGRGRGGARPILLLGPSPDAGERAAWRMAAALEGHAIGGSASSSQASGRAAFFSCRLSAPFPAATRRHPSFHQIMHSTQATSTLRPRTWHGASRPWHPAKCSARAHPST
jgi:hypothetical protein